MRYILFFTLLLSSCTTQIHKVTVMVESPPKVETLPNGNLYRHPVDLGDLLLGAVLLPDNKVGLHTITVKKANLLAFGKGDMGFAYNAEECQKINKFWHCMFISSRYTTIFLSEGNDIIVLDKEDNPVAVSVMPNDDLMVFINEKP